MVKFQPATIYTIIVLAAEFWYAVRAYGSPVE
jgi:hypothetical protein